MSGYADVDVDVLILLSFDGVEVPDIPCFSSFSVMVEVEGDRENVFASGPRWVSLNSAANVSSYSTRHTRPVVGRWAEGFPELAGSDGKMMAPAGTPMADVLLVRFQDIAVMDDIWRRVSKEKECRAENNDSTLAVTKWFAWEKMTPVGPRRRGVGGLERLGEVGSRWQVPRKRTRKQIDVDGHWQAKLVRSRQFVGLNLVGLVVAQPGRTWLALSCHRMLVKR